MLDTYILLLTACLGMGQAIYLQGLGGGPGPGPWGPGSGHQANQRATPTPADFVDDRGDYDFYYHDLTDLMLVVHKPGDICYYIDFGDGAEGNYQRRFTRSDFEDYVIATLNTYQLQSTNHHHHASGRIREFRFKQSSMVEVRGLFQDRLADFHCLGASSVYTVDLWW